MAFTASALLLLATAIFYVVYQRFKASRQRKKLLGPAGLPVVGNIDDLPPVGLPEYQHWLKHKDTHGGVSSVSVLGMTLVIIHDKQAAHDLLEQAAAKISGRSTNGDGEYAEVLASGAGHEGVGGGVPRGSGDGGEAPVGADAGAIEASASVPYRFVRRQMAAGAHRPWYVSKLVEKLRQDGDGELSVKDEESAIWTAATLYSAATDTKVIALTAFTLAMIKLPNVQQKAQEEIDRVVGTDHLPSFHDHENLPYVDAMVKEAIRWWPIAPMGFPHTATEEIEYRGYHIPKDAYLLPAMRWVLHDPSVYSEPESFDPERFLPPRHEPDPGVGAFGYGRRICPGRFFADSGLYLNIVQSLAVFNISKAVDKEEKEMEVDVRPRPGILTYPNEFKCRVSVRSEKHAGLIRQNDRRHGSQEKAMPFFWKV